MGQTGLFGILFLDGVTAIVVHAKAKNNNCSDQDEHDQFMIEQGGDPCATSKETRDYQEEIS